LIVIVSSLVKQAPGFYSKEKFPPAMNGDCFFRLHSYEACEGHVVGRETHQKILRLTVDLRDNLSEI
jgi:hypothetical protein